MMNVLIEDRLCPRFADHDFSQRHMIEAGRHPVCGGFCRYVVTCRRCGTQISETDWIGTPTNPATLRKLADGLLAGHRE